MNNIQSKKIKIRRQALLSLITLMLLPTININAQSDSTNNIWRNNWYIEAGGGIQLLFSSDVTNLQAAQRITPDISLSVGKWFNPFIGIRLQVSGYVLNGFTNPLTNSTFADGYAVTDNVTIRPDGSYRHYLRYANFQVDARTSLFTLFGGVKEHRWDIIPSLGIGYLRTFAYKGTLGTNNISVNLAFMGKFSINKNWDVNLEIGGTVMPNSFDGRITKTAMEGKLGGMLGITYNFGNKPSKAAIRYFDRKNAPKTQRATNDSQNIIEQLSNLNSKLENIERRLENLENAVPKEVQIVVEKTVPVKRAPFTLASIRFELYKSEPIKGQEINYVNIADYLKANPDAKIILSGYGDKESGTPEGNLQISKKRAEAVSKILIDRYGISATRIQTQAIGADSQPYQPNDWNRVVVVTAVE